MHGRRSGLVVVMMLIGAASYGCADQREASSADEAISAPLSDRAPTLSLPVVWRHRGHDVAGPIRELAETTGRVDVRFVGAELPIRGQSTTSQAAEVSVVVPLFGAPTEVETRSFLVRYEVTTAGDGSKVYATSKYESVQFVVVETTVPDAVALFDSTYDPATQEVRRETRFREGDVDLGLTRTSTGTFARDMSFSLWSNTARPYYVVL